MQGQEAASQGRRSQSLSIGNPILSYEVGSGLGHRRSTAAPHCSGPSDACEERRLERAARDVIGSHEAAMPLAGPASSQPRQPSPSIYRGTAVIASCCAGRGDRPGVMMTSGLAWCIYGHDFCEFQTVWADQASRKRLLLTPRPLSCPWSPFICFTLLLDNFLPAYSRTPSVSQRRCCKEDNSVPSR